MDFEERNIQHAAAVVLHIGMLCAGEDDPLGGAERERHKMLQKSKPLQCKNKTRRGEQEETAHWKCHSSESGSARHF